MNKVKVGFIGCGVMGAALAKAVSRAISPEGVTVSDKDSAKASSLATETGCNHAKNNQELIAGSDYVFLAVKPQFLPDLFEELRTFSAHKEKKVWISVAAGISVEKIEKGLHFFSGESKAGNGNQSVVIRLMPNIAALVGEGVMALCSSFAPDPLLVETLDTLLAPAGKTLWINETLMDGITAVSGSGPAYAFLFMEALADAGVKFGISRAQALTLAAQTLKGAASLVLETKKHPAVLKDEVCSPGGTTIAAIQALEKFGFRNAVMEAAEAAYNRSMDLNKN